MVLFAMIILLGCKNSMKGKVGLKCVYMGYACGECEAKYKIKKILSHEYALPEGIKESDLEAIFLNRPIRKGILTISLKTVLFVTTIIFEGSLVKVLRKTLLYNEYR